ncbi:hypothetical protein UFOVP28_46 [uncultured Caudovirales phage]|uniref:Uncharacterized protein n=1 Tax=uncultured Caudovirales phage TaxID=2100421 RepID=A0A6J5KN58_9CAUD|nr:hypothetical protein UFOVP28_46 [uncultured Caudovirales phage]
MAMFVFPAFSILSSTVLNNNFAQCLLTDGSNIGSLPLGSLATSAATTINGKTGAAWSLGDRLSKRSFVEALDFGVASGSPIYGPTNSSVINALMAGISAFGGGTLVLPRGDVYIDTTLDNKYPRVMVVGYGTDTFHDSGVSTAANPMYGTRLMASSATPMLKLRTPYAAEQGVAVGNTWKYCGSGFKGLSLNGQATATSAIVIDSVGNVDVDIYATNFNSTQFVTVQCGITGTDLGEACDVSNSSLVFRLRMIDTAADIASNGVLFTGSINANVCLNQRVIINGQYKNGTLFKCVSADNNSIWLQATRASGGSGNAVYMCGPTVIHPTGGENNFFTYINSPSSGLIYNEGTDTGGVTAGIYNRVLAQDTSNGGSLPTSGTGSSWSWETSKNVLVNKALGPTAISNDANTGAPAQRALMSSETLRVHNQSSNHVRFTNGSTDEWAINVNGTSGLRITSPGGTGNITLGGVSPLAHSILSSSTSYANDAAAAGGGVAIGQLYRNGSVVQIRIT